MTGELFNCLPAVQRATQVKFPLCGRSELWRVLKRLCTVFLYCKKCIIIITIPGPSRREAWGDFFLWSSCQISDENILLYFQSFDMNKRMIIITMTRESFYTFGFWALKFSPVTLWDLLYHQGLKDQFTHECKLTHPLLLLMMMMI